MKISKTALTLFAFFFLVHSNQLLADSAYTVHVQADGRILAAGTSEWEKSVLMRLLPNGQLDTTFSGLGILKDDLDTATEFVSAIHTFSDNKILALVPSASCYLVRYLPDGQRDKSFGANGVVVLKNGNTPLCSATMAVQQDGRIVMASPQKLEVYRFMPDGSIDKSFGEGGVANLGFPNEGQTNQVSLQNDQKILIAGYSIHADDKMGFATARLLPNGQLDPSFGIQGRFLATNMDGNAGSVSLDANGNIFLFGDSLSGRYRFTAIKLTPDGKLDPTFGSMGMSRPSFGYESFASQRASLVIQQDRLLACGSYYPASENDLGNAVAVRFGTNGGIEETIRGDEATECNAMAFSPTKEIFLAGQQTGIYGEERPYGFYLMKLNPYGSLDRSFGNEGTVVIHTDQE